MDRFLKRIRDAQAGAPGNTKCAKSTPQWGDGSPRTIAAWNCNGLTARVRGRNAEEIRSFVAKHNPDALFLSEVRIAAANNASGKPGPHTKWMRGQMRDSDKKSMEDVAGVRRLLASDELSSYRVWWSLADSKYAGTALLLRRDTVSKPDFVRFNLEDEKCAEASLHEKDGRVIFAGFKDFAILHTYVPNNGWDDGHFKRRREWDEKVEQFMENQKKLGRRVIWVGDLNVAPTDADLSDPKHYRRQKKGKSVDEDDVGQPGCTNNERRRFQAILDSGNLVDAFRQLYEDKKELTWRGVPTGMHGGKGMRIDHCVCSKELVSSCSDCEDGEMKSDLKVTQMVVVGQGVKRSGFMGSDHSPIIIKLTSAS